jgi:transcriptional regulator with XRE-family HTH domain
MPTESPTKSDVTVLPKAVKAWRGIRGISQEGLAEKSGVSAGMIALIETGRRQPGLGNLLAIAAALEVEPEVIAIIHIDLSPIMAATDTSTGGRVA